MALKNVFTLKGISNIGDETVSSNILYSLQEFYKWGFLSIGAYQNITKTPPTSGVYGGQRFKLAHVKDYQVYEGFRPEWVWESGVMYNPQPTGVTVYVNGNPISSNSYKIDYRQGRIIFNSPLSAASGVEADFAHRVVHVMRANDEHFRHIIRGSFRVDFADVFNRTSGIYVHATHTRIYLPVIAIGLAGFREYRPYQQGGGQWMDQRINYFCISENLSDTYRLMDIVTNQNDKIIRLLDLNKMKRDNRWPFGLNYDGSINKSGFFVYPQLVSDEMGFHYGNMRIKNTRILDIVNMNDKGLFVGIVGSDTEIVLPSV